MTACPSFSIGIGPSQSRLGVWANSRQSARRNRLTRSHQHPNSEQSDGGFGRLQLSHETPMQKSQL